MSNTDWRSYILGQIQQRNTREVSGGSAALEHTRILFRHNVIREGHSMLIAELEQERDKCCTLQQKLKDMESRYSEKVPSARIAELEARNAELMKALTAERSEAMRRLQNEKLSNKHREDELLQSRSQVALLMNQNLDLETKMRERRTQSLPALHQATLMDPDHGTRSLSNLLGADAGELDADIRSAMPPSRCELSVQVDTSEASLHEFKKREAMLRNRIAELESGKELDRLKSVVSVLKERLRTSEERMRQVAEQATRDVEAAIERSSKELSALKEGFEVPERTTHAAELARAEAEEVLSTLRAKIVQLENLGAEREASFTRTIAAVKAEERENHGEYSRLLEARLAMLSASNEALEKQARKMDQSVSEKTEFCEGLSAKVHALQSQLETKVEDCLTHETRAKKAEEALLEQESKQMSLSRTYREELQSFQEQLVSKTNDCTQFIERVKQLEGINQILTVQNGELQGLRDQLDSKKHEAHICRERVALLEEEIDRTALNLTKQQEAHTITEKKWKELEVGFIEREMQLATEVRRLQDQLTVYEKAASSENTTDGFSDCLSFTGNDSEAEIIRLKVRVLSLSEELQKAEIRLAAGSPTAGPQRLSPPGSNAIFSEMLEDAEKAHVGSDLVTTILSVLAGEQQLKDLAYTWKEHCKHRLSQQHRLSEQLAHLHADSTKMQELIGDYNKKLSVLTIERDSALEELRRTRRQTVSTKSEASPPKEWTCKYCTFVNKCAGQKCTCCDKFN